MPTLAAFVEGQVDRRRLSRSDISINPTVNDLLVLVPQLDHSLGHQRAQNRCRRLRSGYKTRLLRLLGTGGAAQAEMVNNFRLLMTQPTRAANVVRENAVGDIRPIESPFH